MTSVMRSFTQIPARIKYFITLDTRVEDNIVFVQPFTYNSVFTLSSLPAPVLSESNFVSTYSDPSGYVIPAIESGQLLKDLGQQFIVTDDNHKHRAVYRRVQMVHGLTSEGVGGTPVNRWNTFYVKVWDADADANPSEPITVIRTG